MRVLTQQLEALVPTAVARCSQPGLLQAGARVPDLAMREGALVSAYEGERSHAQLRTHTQVSAITRVPALATGVHNSGLLTHGRPQLKTPLAPRSMKKSA